MIVLKLESTTNIILFRLLFRDIHICNILVFKIPSSDDHCKVYDV